MPEMPRKAPIATPSPAIPLQRTPDQITVLVVDDDKSVRDLIAVILECEGYQVLTAASGAEAIRKAAELHPDLVTLDVMMPDMDGWEVGRQLAENPETASIRRLVVSAKPMAELEASAGRMFAHAVLTKPFDFAAFVGAIESVMNPRHEPAH
ncbi:MAG TPA: response regulator [Mycobacteriales bacterium]|nr:response regulator [Mycobacteriales bacterium]